MDGGLTDRHIRIEDGSTGALHLLQKRPMPEHKIDPQTVTKPLQLLAAWLVALIVLDTAFLTAAATIKAPDWAPAILVIASVANVPLFLFGMFLLQTKYRPEMQEDSFYSVYLRDQRKLNDLGSELESYLNKAGIDLKSLTAGQSLKDASIEIQRKIDSLLSEMKQTLLTIENVKPSSSQELSPEPILELAKALMAQGQWTEAAKQFDEYIKYRSSEWEVHFSRAVAYSNAREGLASNIASLRSYNEAIALAPSDLGIHLRARLFSYRGAILKRLRRLDEAEADLTVAQKYAFDDYERNDIKYNLAGVYALRGDRSRLLETIKQLRNAPQYLMAIQAHMGDYFADFANDKEFLRAITL